MSPRTAQVATSLHLITRQAPVITALRALAPEPKAITKAVTNLANRFQLARYRTSTSILL